MSATDMQAEESLKTGRLEEALSELQDRVRQRPDDSKLRVFLFQLLCVLGQWDRALTQLNVAGELDAGALAMVQTYRIALHCEALRNQVFAGEQTPLVFGEPDEWMGPLIEAVKLTANGHHAQSQELRLQAFDAAPATPGRVDDEPFEWIADMDSRLGPVLEAIVDGKYYWIPFERVHEIRIEPPSDLRDLVWLPAQFVWANEGESVGLIPTRYPGSETSADHAVRMARRTDWDEIHADVYLGQGQRMLATDAGEYPLMDIRRVELGDPRESGSM